jgi:hypothetical protein
MTTILCSIVNFHGNFLSWLVVYSFQMVLRKRFRWSIVLAGLVIAGGVVFWVLHWSQEENAVYEAVIRDNFNDYVSQHVIVDTTRPIDQFGIPAFHSRKLGLPLNVAVSYSVKNLFQFHIPMTFRLPHPLISPKDLKTISADVQAGRSRVNELNPILQDISGVITFSRVGFDPSGKHAIVSVQLTNCGFCGEGEYLYLSKETGEWHIVGTSLVWVS